MGAPVSTYREPSPFRQSNKSRQRLRRVLNVAMEKGMNNYASNSPEAISRVLAMMMITDAKLDERELEVLDELNIYELVGISRDGFAQVVQEYCEDLLQSSNPQERVRLVDKDRIDRIIDCVDDRHKRIYTCGMLLNVANADGQISDSEMAVFTYILERWGLSLEELEAEFTKQ